MVIGVVFLLFLTCLGAGFLLGVWYRGRGHEGPTLARVESLLTELRTDMATATERIQAALDATHAALANIVTDIATIKAKISDGVPTTEVLDALDALATKAQEIADSTPDA